MTRITIMTPIPDATLVSPLARALDFDFKTAHRQDSGPRPLRERIAADRAPDLSVHKHLAGGSRRDWFANFADLSNQAFGTGFGASSPVVRDDIANPKDNRGQARRSTVNDVAADHQVGARSVDEEQRPDNEGDNSAQTQHAIAGNERLGYQHCDAKQYQEESRQVHGQDLERREREQKTNGAGDTRQEHARVCKLEVKPNYPSHQEEIDDVGVREDVE